jgi:AcrR family transcriptional regulator
VIGDGALMRTEPGAVETQHRVKPQTLECADHAFQAHGFAGLTMGMLAEACALSRRALYHHFRNKQEVFRATLVWKNARDAAKGLAAGLQALERGDSPGAVITAFLDARFGETRREVGSSVHGRELNDLAFSLCGDILVEVSVGTNAALARLVQGLVERGALRLRDGVSAEKVGRLLGDGARGVNQARPPIPNHLFAQHYREIAEAILFGCAAG